MYEEIFFKVTIEGEDVSDLLENLQVDESDDRCNMANLTFGDSNLVLADLLCEGLSVEIDLGYCDAHGVIFRGLITGLQASFPARGRPQVTVDAMDSLIKLGFKPKTRQWRGEKLKQIVERIATEDGRGLRPGKIELRLGKTNPEDDVTIDEMYPYQQVEKTDLEFLLELARDYDAKLYADHRDSADTLNFVSTQILLEAEPLEEPLIFNANLENLSVSLASSNTATEKRLVTTHPETGEVVESRETLAEVNEAQWTPASERIARVGPGAERLSRLAAKVVVKQAELQKYWRQPPREVGAPSRLPSDRSRTLGDHARRLGQTALGQARGSFWLRPYRRVRVEGVGGRWSGDWYVSQVQHQVDITQRSYISSFSCTR